MQEGNVYKFTYKNEVRLAFVIENSYGLVSCWDYAKRGYRNFKKENIQNLENMESSVLVVKNTDKNKKQCDAYNLSYYEYDGHFYAVNI